MLSEYELRELATIEERLLRDRALSACFQGEPSAGRRPVLRPRCLVVPGILIMLVAGVLELGAAFAQGLGLVVLGLAWWIATSAVFRRRAKRFITYCIETFERSWLPPDP